MAVDNAGRIVADPGETRREMGRAEDKLRADLDKVAFVLGDFTQALIGARAGIALIEQKSAELGLDRTRVIAESIRQLDKAQKDLRDALAQATVPGKSRPASVKKADDEADAMVEEAAGRTATAKAADPFKVSGNLMTDTKPSAMPAVKPPFGKR